MSVLDLDVAGFFSIRPGVNYFEMLFITLQLLSKFLHYITITQFFENVCLFVLRLNVPVNNFSVMSGRSHRFLGN